MTTLRRKLAAWLNPPPPPPRKPYCLRVDCAVITLYEVKSGLVMFTVHQSRQALWGMQMNGHLYMTAKAACAAMLHATSIHIDDVEIEGDFAKIHGLK